MTGRTGCCDDPRVSADLPFPTRPGTGLPGPLGSLQAGSEPDAAGGPAGTDRAPGSALRTVRLAWAADAPAVAAVQAADLRRVLALRPEVADLPTAPDLEPVWLRAITRPPTARHRVLVAVELDAVVGFAATAPAEDPDSDVATDGELLALHVVPRSRPGVGPAAGEAAVAELLAALAAGAADTLAADGFTRAQIWVTTTDDVLRVVLSEAGWTPDGASRSALPDELPPDELPSDQMPSDQTPYDEVPSDEVPSGQLAAHGAAEVAGPGQPLNQVRLHVGLDGS